MGGEKHTYHMVERSGWPIIGAGGAMTLAIGLIVYMHYGQPLVLITGILAIIGTMLG